MNNKSFISIDFETATGKRTSACAVAIVTVENGEIVDSFYTLIQPPNNYYSQFCIDVHGITPADTADSPSFAQIYTDLHTRMQGKTVVAHNAPFDNSVLRACMEQARLDYTALRIADKWQCTLSIYRNKGFKPCKLSDCCHALDIELDHHQALSDAQACAQLFLRR